MSYKTTKDAVEHFGGVWPDNCEYISCIDYGDHIKFEAVPEGGFEVVAMPLTAGIVIKHQKCKLTEVTKEEFEDYVREAKMEKQKYKYVPATGMDIWDLGKEISLGATYFDELKHPIYIDDSGCLKTVRWDQGGLSRKIEELQITYRKLLSWHEIKDNYPCLASIAYDTGKCSPVLLHDIDEFNAYNDPHNHIRVVGIRFVIRLCDIEGYCTPLTPTEAAKYGVECD